MKVCMLSSVHSGDNWEHGAAELNNLYCEIFSQRANA
jgi:hypothetical protein